MFSFYISLNRKQNPFFGARKRDGKGMFLSELILLVKIGHNLQETNNDFKVEYRLVEKKGLRTWGKQAQKGLPLWVDLWAVSSSRSD